MFFYLSTIINQDLFLFNLLKYITFRSGGALITGLLLSFIFAPFIINWLKKNQGRKNTIREDVPNRHLIKKRGTPTMGGLLILLSFIFSTLLWSDLKKSKQSLSEVFFLIKGCSISQSA